MICVRTCLNYETQNSEPHGQNSESETKGITQNTLFVRPYCGLLLGLAKWPYEPLAAVGFFSSSFCQVGQFQNFKRQRD